MSLTDFFRINLPYGMRKNSSGKWFAFNREYTPLGWNSQDKAISIHEDNPYPDYPIYTKYKGLTDNAILKIIKDPDVIKRNDNGEIVSVFFYKDITNPQSHPEYWADYFEIIKQFSKLEIQQ
ncbi:hypothetical protein J7E50_09755 [Pedobacter sp. ISL-68]|uniref:hypothetical protein n=1 Tax=unclassified Pedobacter TaxID=2628915 RepID=UPI001BEB6F1E|nr:MULTISPECIES: hypothetical protein [unclassified Pedobacter]MBT2561114.1 hypothetical protein [Pedobacter sp. ISL-64]MBT2590503.1 hypothetical protein [Pedobacter sp. ISL-68]